MADDSSDSQQLKLRERIAILFMPNVGDVVFALVIAFLLWLHPCSLFSDGSTGWHLVTGEHILHSGVPHTDLISYTFPDKSWAAYEWLFDVLITIPVNLNNGSLNLLAVCVSCAIASLILLLYRRCRKEGATFPFALVIVILGCAISTIHWLVLPHIFTFFGVFFFTAWLEEFWRGSLSGKKLSLLLTGLMILWVNMHPAFLIGLVLVGINFASAIMAAICSFGTEKFQDFTHKTKVLAATMACCIAATLATPYGLELQEYMLNYMKSTSGLANVTQDFLSPIFHGGFHPMCLELLYALFILGLAISIKRLSLPRLLTCLAFTHLSLSAVRYMPLYAIVILPAISQLFSNVSFGEPEVKKVGEFEEDEQHWITSLRMKWRKVSEGFDKNESLCNKHMVSLAVFLVLSSIALNNGQFFGKQALNSTWSNEDKPTATLDYLIEQEKTGKLDPERGFNYDNWGGYLRYKSGKRVFIDDRAEFYGQPFYEKYTVVALNQQGWDTALGGYIYKGTKKQGSTVQWLLMPRNSSISASLRSSKEWGNPVKEDRASELFVRKESAATAE